ncbi:capsular biosynthesis protein [Methylobacterium sp. Leaf456]|uniref:glycosyltransferase family 61 protein n=1 Tax=Methylobacterium sp. Leaf456 TaxID=1736382 RepID=UPI0006FE053D|nr:glycosyltransferase family 61 protein [Methylobacterium sp. Leaf456]KQT60825.1 capsular biosynthesis protein [Methylobacterium sp. Leaf456]
MTGEPTQSASSIWLTDNNLVLSCEAARLYGEGGFPGDADLLARLSGRVARHTRVLDTVFPGCPARAPGTPRLHGGSTVFRVGQAARFAAEFPPVPPTLLLESRDIRLSGNALYTLSDGRPEILFETVRPQERHVTPGPGPDPEPYDEAVGGEGLTFLLNSGGSFNYGHWLIDDLPRLRALALLRACYPGQPITVALVAYVPHVDAARARSVALFLGDPRDVTVRFLDRTKTYRFAQAHHATPCGLPNDRKSPDALRFLRETIRRRTRMPRLWQRLRRLGRTPEQRLFIDRQPDRGRALVERDAVMALLARHGFTVIDPETLSPRQQAIRFADAEIVVGIAGAGMANTVFCRPGTPVIHLVPEGWQDPFYWEIAVACGLTYHAVFGPRVASDAPDFLRDFRVDPADIAEALKESGLCPDPPRAGPWDP